MKVIKKVGLTASLVLASSFASAAINLGDLTDTTVTYSVSSVPVGSFLTVFDFNITANSLFSASAVSNVTSIIEFTLFETSGVGGGGLLYNTGSFSFAELDDVVLSAGSYSLNVGGNATAINSGYVFEAGAVSVVSVVPEPSSIALMLGGLGLVGFMAARRKKA